MLILLHSALWWDFGGPLSRSLMLAHLGLFLIWQPVWRRDQRLAARSSLVFILVTVAFTLWLNWWLMAFWLLLLTGLVSVRVIVGRVDRYVYLSTLLFLVSELLIGCIPRMFSVESLAAEVQSLFQYGLPLLPATLLFIPAYEEPGQQRAQTVDLLYGLTMPLLATVEQVHRLCALLPRFLVGRDEQEGGGQ